MEAAPQPGLELNERYRLIRPLARGGMGSVWRAEHLTLNSEVAVKIIDPTLASQDIGLTRFMREARALAALHSPYIVQVIDFGSQDGIVYLVMELLEGKTLGQRLKVEGRLSPAETSRILSDVCKAMGHAHDRGIVHRDLKPDNIFLCDAGREHVSKVLDFGIAKPRGLEGGADADTGVGAFLGTPSYMSPEQCRGETIDPRSDLWAIGAIAYECLSGERLFSGNVVGMVVRICSGELPLPGGGASLPPGFVPWLQRALALDPARRFQSATELYAALAPVLGGAPQPARGVDSAETLSDGMAPVQEAAQPSASSTLAHGTVERLARRSEVPRPGLFSWRVAGSAVAALVVLAFLLRRTEPFDGTDATVTPAVSPAVAAAARPEGSSPADHTEPAAASPEPGARAAEPGGNADAGVSAAAEPSAAKPAPQRPEVSGEPLVKPSRRATTRQGAAPEMEQLRKTR